MENVIKAAAGQILANSFCFDEYIGEQIGQDKKSLAFSLNYGAVAESVAAGFSPRYVAQAKEPVPKVKFIIYGSRMAFPPLAEACAKNIKMLKHLQV